MYYKFMLTESAFNLPIVSEGYFQVDDDYTIRGIGTSFSIFGKVEFFIFGVGGFEGQFNFIRINPEGDGKMLFYHLFQDSTGEMVEAKCLECPVGNPAYYRDVQIDLRRCKDSEDILRRFQEKEEEIFKYPAMKIFHNSHDIQRWWILIRDTLA